MRLDKYLASNTALSRNEVKQALKSGRVSLDGDICRSAKQHIAPEQNQIELDQKRINPLGELYLMLNKPKAYVSARKDAQQPCVFDLLRAENSYANTISEQLLKAHTAKLSIVGRLDQDTTGLLLLTTDGQWNHRICSPKTECIKTYIADLARPLRDDAEQLFEQGLQLHGDKELTAPATLKRLDAQKACLSIYEGRYHQVKRMFAAIGNHVDKLHRESIGKLKLDTQLQAGQFRLLSPDEVALF
ncbi:pseudouridine synthase [Agaribacterium sp. ZY112]|uniref:pseudouridine synthase n=1 Tax=Agaribacterium sp. ZY112 TaxID=3233574 RepID=UPI0035238FE4